MTASLMNGIPSTVLPPTGNNVEVHLLNPMIFPCHFNLTSKFQCVAYSSMVDLVVSCVDFTITSSGCSGFVLVGELVS